MFVIIEPKIKTNIFGDKYKSLDKKYYSFSNSSLKPDCSYEFNNLMELRNLICTYGGCKDITILFDNKTMTIQNHTYEEIVITDDVVYQKHTYDGIKVLIYKNKKGELELL